MEIWPENEQAISLFTEISGQWLVGMGGPTALNYLVLFARLERLKLCDAEHEQLFQDVRIIESEALQILNKKDE